MDSLGEQGLEEQKQEKKTTKWHNPVLLCLADPGGAVYVGNLYLVQLEQNPLGK